MKGEKRIEGGREAPGRERKGVGGEREREREREGGGGLLHCSESNCLLTTG